MKRNLSTGIVSLLLIAALGATGCGSKNESKDTVFSPKLDTEKSITLNTTGFFSNFEAFDQVTNDFNQYYPNVEFNYEQVSGNNFEEYMDANPNVDILMTSDELFEKLGSKLEDSCADFSKEEIDFSDIEEDMLSAGNHNNHQFPIPMGQNIYGMVVNVSLLEKEGLSVPTTYHEFTDVLTALKNKGYTPIQGPDSKVYAELTESMLFDMILDDETLCKDLKAGKKNVAGTLQPILDKLNDIVDNGFTDLSVNQTYPADNYDGAIMNFFEGNVPFWVCNTEKVSGMKKRESKSEAFQADPFDYTFTYVPLGENGAYAYREPWYGFSVNKNSENYEYAIEFIRFLVTKDEINKMGDIKGVPSIASQKTDVEIYKNVLNPENPELSYINDGTITPSMVSNWYTCVNKYIAGEFATEKEALETFVEECSK